MEILFFVATIGEIKILSPIRARMKSLMWQSCVETQSSLRRFTAFVNKKIDQSAVTMTFRYVCSYSVRHLHKIMRKITATAYKLLYSEIFVVKSFFAFFRIFILPTRFDLWSWKVEKNTREKMKIIRLHLFEYEKPEIPKIDTTSYLFWNTIVVAKWEIKLRRMRCLLYKTPTCKGKYQLN